MANNHRTPYEPSLLALPPVLQNKDGNLGANGILSLLAYVRGLGVKANGLLSFGRMGDGDWLGNLDGQSVQIITPGVANTEIEVFHGLGRVPRGRIVLAQDKAGSLYDTRLGGWSETKVYFKSDATAATFVVALL